MFGDNHAEDWRALTERYRGMQDEELLELAADFKDLTPAAQQALRDELKARRLPDAESARTAPGTPKAPLPLRNRPSGWTSDISFGASGGFGVPAPELVSDEPDASDQTTGPVEYTWKTPLCEYESDEQAWQISEVLRRAGIESWIEGAKTYAHSSGSIYSSIEEGNRRVLVAADQLEQAQAIVAQPIPQDIIEESRRAPDEYEPPVCPKCGAADPVLESADPVNAWKCDVCGAEWSEGAADAAGSTLTGAE